MMDCKSMATPMVTNLKKLRGSDSNLVDPSIYKRLIGMLMYLVNTRPDICFVVNTLNEFQIEPRHEHWIAAKHILRYLRGLFGQELELIVIHCDNQTRGKLSENPVFHDRSKHIEIKYHYIRDIVQSRAIRLEYISTDEQTTDILTKLLPRDKFIDKMGLMEINPLIEREC
eukprot:PITA_02994